jgi:polyisoprenoid-binding protein YceI
MSKNLLIAIGIIGVVIVVGAVAYVLRPSAEASAPIEAIPVEVDEIIPEEDQSGEPDQTPVAQMPNVEDEAVSEDPDEEVVVIEKSEDEVVESPPNDVLIFSIVQAESEVRFTLGELLSGVPTTVVGATDQVAGEIAIDPENPAETKLGVIRVNARTFVTDNNFRNRAINNSILQTEQYEFVTFMPTEISGFPDNPAIGQPLEFQISGDLTIRDITQSVTFDVTVTAVSETRLEGSGSAVLNRADYDLRIPEVPRVADVDEEVLLEVDFVAILK